MQELESISVIIPVWNREKTIERAIRSVLNQTLKPLEVLVCDDGSTDKTLEIVSSINDPRVILIEGPRAGRPAIPRNRGIKAAKGEWIAFLDSDDYWKENKLQIQMEKHKNSKLLASSTNATGFFPENEEVGQFLFFPKSKITFKDLLFRNSVSTSSLIVHRSVLEKVGGFPEDPLTPAEDWALWLKTATQTDILFIDKELIYYQIDYQNSVSGTFETYKQNLWKKREYICYTFTKWAEENNIPKKYINLSQNILKPSFISKKRYILHKLIKSIRLVPSIPKIIKLKYALTHRKSNKNGASNLLKFFNLFCR